MDLNSQQPTLSVLMSNYNHAHFLPESLQAMVDQADSILEIIIVDDGSTDSSVEVIRSFASAEPKLRFIRNERNLGLIDNLNRLLELAAGDYVYMGAADDRVLPGLFEKSLAMLAEYPQAGLCCSDPMTFDDQTGAKTENREHLGNQDIYFSPAHLQEVMNRQNIWIAGHTSVMKRTALLEAGGLIPELKWHCDWFAVLVMAFRHGICYIPEPLAALRNRSDSYSAAGTQQRDAQREVLAHLLNFLRSSAYQDVRPYFMQTGVLTVYGLPMLQVILGQPGLKDRDTLRLLWPTFMTAAKGRLYRNAPDPLKEMYHSIRDR